MNRITKRVAAASLVLAMFSGMQAASAATTTTTFTVTATVLASCNLGSVATLPFGLYDPTSGSNADATTGIAVTCTIGTPYNVGLSGGTTTGGTVAQRKMQGLTVANKLNYNLYRDAARTQVWGETILNDTVVGLGTGFSQTHTVYGRITAGSAASIDAYSDTITVTVTY
jgi:spore coat protein U-like protein